ncbi:hypothetical protein V490_02367 [Pseudogymnoascus sp. VKM F-3557]|nr:hypothetical protein V490_02367 [Pseudogymnoascus sp. VKM F-3557]
MFRLNTFRQTLFTRPRISEAISNTGLHRAMHISAPLHPRYSSSSHSRRKSTVDRATIFTNPRSHGKSIIMSKWSQCKESNDAATNMTTSPATGIMSLSTTAHVSFEIVSARRFAREFRRGRNGVSMAFQELQEDLEEMRRSENEHRAEMQRIDEELFAEIQRIQEEFLAGIGKEFDRLDRHLILITIVAILLAYGNLIFDLLHEWYKSSWLKSELENRGLVLQDYKVQNCNNHIIVVLKLYTR